jgi:hypothetical protein
MLSRQAELEQYPIDPKNPLHPDETSVSVARRGERQEEHSAFLSSFHQCQQPTNARCGRSKPGSKRDSTDI